MNQHSIPFMSFISIAIGSLAILLLLFAVTLNIFLTIRFLIGFYGILSLIALIYYFIDQQEIKKLNDYATETKLYNDRISTIGEATKLQREIYKSNGNDEARKALDDMDSHRVDDD